MFGYFESNRQIIEEQYRQTSWNETSGLAPDLLLAKGMSLTEELTAQGLPRPIIKARLFEMVMDNAQIAAEPAEFFQDHLRHEFIVQKQRSAWIKETTETVLADVHEKNERMKRLGLTTASWDFGHTVPDWYEVLALGMPGLLKRVRDTKANLEAHGTLTLDQAVFYESCEITYCAAIRYVARLAAECRRVAKSVTVTPDKERLLFCAEALDALCVREPRTLHEALQLSYIFHILQEEVEGERLRSLGGMDRLYRPLYEADLAAGRLTREQAGELLKDFFQKFHALTGDTLYGEPLYIGGVLPGDIDAVNDLTWLIIDSFDALSIANPKIHVRIHQNNPPEFLRRICDCIRNGNSSFVLISDECAIPMMQKVGCTADEAREYVPIGCYEPGILGREVACTGNGGFVMPKALELALHNGVDPITGESCGPQTGLLSSFDTFEKLIEAVWQQMKFLIDHCAATISTYEKHYLLMNPSPLFSATMPECVEKGMDAYSGGAKYNNSSLYAYSNATLADSLAMLYKWVYRDNRLSLNEFVEILDKNWENAETLRLKLLRDEDKWGNDRELPDKICVELSERFAAYANSLPNGRGGRFKAAMYTIDYNYAQGKRVGATPDGRHAGDPLSRNLGATSGMDRNGVTALIRSCTKLDLTNYPTGTVLDVMLHPTAVAGETGLDAFCTLIRSYFAMGGYAIHGNVFDAEVLRAAQSDPQKHRNLQVRVCGWNVYFVNLSKHEQDEFIFRAECAQA